MNAKETITKNRLILKKDQLAKFKYLWDINTKKEFLTIGNLTSKQFGF